MTEERVHDDPRRTIHPGRRDRTQCRPQDGDAISGQFRRPSDPGRLALSFLRDQSGAEIRPQKGARHAARYRRRHRGAVRAGANPRRPARGARRQASRLWFSWRRDGKAVISLGTIAAILPPPLAGRAIAYGIFYAVRTRTLFVSRDISTGRPCERRDPYGENFSFRHDGRRDEWFASRGYRVLRFTNEDVMKNLEGVVIAIALAAEQAAPPPPPPPPPRRGGGQGAAA